MSDHRRYGELLRRRIEDAEGQQAELRAAIASTRAARSLTFADDEHDPEGSTASLDQARDVALLQRVEQTLTELHAARVRIEAGTYGVCEQCGTAIRAERLTARPEARLCVQCSGRSVRSGRRRD